ncbi:MAG: hypothetical protein ABEJ40_10435 [Haloarculaceae archaeon]
MSERTDERTSSSGESEADVEDLLGDVESGVGAGDAAESGAAGDVGFADDELGVDVDALTGDPPAASGRAESADGPTADESERGGSGWLSRLRPSLGVPNPLASLPSGRSVLVTFGVVVVSMLLAGSVPLLGAVGSGLGIFAAGFLLGLLSGKRRYLELFAAGGVAAGASALLEVYRFALLANVGVAPFAALGAGTGIAAALLGHYFGRDLRAGLTTSVE